MLPDREQPPSEWVGDLSTPMVEFQLNLRPKLIYELIEVKLSKAELVKM